MGEKYLRISAFLNWAISMNKSYKYVPEMTDDDYEFLRNCLEILSRIYALFNKSGE